MTEYGLALRDVQPRRVLGVVEDASRRRRLTPARFASGTKPPGVVVPPTSTGERRRGAVGVVGHLDEVGGRLPAPEG